MALVGKAAKGNFLNAQQVTAINGVATYSGLTLTKARKRDVLRVTASGLTPASTSTFNVSAVRATALTRHSVSVVRGPFSVATGGQGRDRFMSRFPFAFRGCGEQASRAKPWANTDRTARKSSCQSKCSGVFISSVRL